MIIKSRKGQNQRGKKSGVARLCLSRSLQMLDEEEKI